MWNWTVVDGMALAVAICFVVQEHRWQRRRRRVQRIASRTCSGCVFAAMCSESGCYCRVQRQVMPKTHAASCPEYLALDDVA